MKNTRRFLQSALVALWLLEIFATSSHQAYAQTRAINFANGFEQPIVVKLVGLITRGTEIPPQHMRALQVSPGEYVVWMRSGSAPEQYTYFRGDSIFVLESFTPDSALTLALSPDTSASSSLHASTNEEFEKIIVDSWQTNELVAYVAPAASVPVDSNAVATTESRADTTQVEPRLAEAMSTTAAPDSQEIAQARPILAQALRVARESKDNAERLRGLLTVMPLLNLVDSSEARVVLDEARVLAPKLSEGPTLLEIMGMAALQGLALGLLDIATGGSSYIFPAGSFGRIVESNARYSDHSREYQAATIYARTVKQRLTLLTIRELAEKNPVQAFDLALTLKEDYARVIALERVLLSWPVAQSEAMVAKVRELASPSQKEKPSPALLAVFAIGIAPHEPALALELTQRALREMGTKPMPVVYRALAHIDSAAAHRHLKKLLVNPAVVKDPLYSFANGAARPQPGLAWEALQSVDQKEEKYPEALVRFARNTASIRPVMAWEALLRIDKGNKKFLAERGELLRLLMPALPAELTTSARDYALELLATPSYQPTSVKFSSFTGDLREEFRKLSAVSDVLIMLGKNEPDFARQQAEQVVFSEYLAQTYILERSGFLKKVSPAFSKINPEDKPLKENLERTFFRDVVKLELAFSRQLTDPTFTLAILDSLDNPFWMALTYTARRQVIPNFDPIKEPDPEGLQSRLNRLLTQVKSHWPALALANQDARSAPANKKSNRFLEVAAMMDFIAVAIYNDKKDWRPFWLDYMPFALAYAGAALSESDSAAAQQAFQTSLNIAAELPSPAREWVDCWNAATWRAAGQSLPLGENKRAVQVAAALTKHEPWEDSLPLLIAEVARLDDAVALQMAQRIEAKPMKTQALVVVASRVLFDR